jgi:hypothetical protein
LTDLFGAAGDRAGTAIRGFSPRAMVHWRAALLEIASNSCERRGSAMSRTLPAGPGTALGRSRRSISGARNALPGDLDASSHGPARYWARAGDPGAVGRVPSARESGYGEIE